MTLTTDLTFITPEQFYNNCPIKDRYTLEQFLNMLELEDYQAHCFANKDLVYKMNMLAINLQSGEYLPYDLLPEIDFENLSNPLE